MRCSLFLSITLLAACAAAAGATGPLISTPLGSIQGTVMGDETGMSEAFLGLPYAQPPVGNLRWNNTVPVAAWAPATLDGTQFSAGCPQRCELPPHNCPASQSEDCLYLNVYTPLGQAGSPSATPLPVYFWMPGGRFEQGAAGTLLYFGAYLANWTNTVVVTTNYRLGVLACLYTDSAHGSVAGNFGLQDQITALRWVQANIASFGGDPSRVTIGGQSAGAQSTAVLLASPLTKGLYHQAVMESNPFTLGLHPNNIAAGYGAKFLDDAGCTTGERSCLLDLSIDQILAAQTASQKSTVWQEIFALIGEFMPWTPVVDGVWVAAQPMDAMTQGTWNKVPVLMGTVSEEARIFIWQAWGNALSALDYDLLIFDVFGLDAGRVFNLYPLATAEDRIDARNVTADMGTDWIFTCPYRLVSRSIAADVPLFVYQFNHSLSFGVEAWGANYSFCFGHVCHGSELPFEFNSIKPYFNFTADEATLGHDLATAWGNFIHSGSPNVGNPISLEWPQYSSMVDEVYVWMAGGNAVTTSLRSSYCDVLDTIGYDGWNWEG